MPTGFWTILILSFVVVLTAVGRAQERPQAGEVPKDDRAIKVHPPAADESRSARPQEQVLRERAEEAWKARLERDCKTTARFMDPKEYIIETPEKLVQICEEDPFRYEKYRIGKVETDGNFGWIWVDYAVRAAEYVKEPAQEMSIVEKWRLVDGLWYPIASRIEETCPEPRSKRDAAEEQRLRARFDQTWPLRLARDWKALYQLTDPKDRDRVPETQFVESESLIEYFEHEVDWVQVIGDRGELRVTYTNKLADPSMTKMNRRKINISEKWIKRDGEWYRDLLRTN
jgi:hypothetical protein